MNSDELRAQIEAAASAFDAQLHTKAYEEETSDPDQLRRLLSFLSPRSEQVFLDLGTGAGYLAMAIAKEHPTSEVIGLDIAEGAIKKNGEIARQEGLTNVHFRVFDGVNLPFTDSTFDGAVCRYAFHHFPRPEATLAEIARTVRRRGKFVLADAIRSEYDEIDFVNRFQNLQPDGHVRMYQASQLTDLVSRYGFDLLDSFESSISFGRRRAKEYDDLLASTPAQSQEAYDMTITEDDMHLTFRILNAVYVNRKHRS